MTAELIHGDDRTCVPVTLRTGRRTHCPGSRRLQAGCRGAVAGAATVLIIHEHFDHFNEAVPIW